MKKIKYILFALLAALLYAINIPFSKIMLQKLNSTFLAGLLYLGAGIGIGILFLIKRKKYNKEDLLTKKDIPYTISMVVLDIIAPILLMYGLKISSASSASLLNNFEIVATALIALFIFKEFISFKMWIAIILVTLSSFLLCIDDFSNFAFDKGSIFIILATICWGIENNCTRKISNKNNYEIVMIKGLCCGISSITISIILGNRDFNILYILIALLLGFVSYGLSILFYIKAQAGIGASKTSAFYAINPFIGSILSFVIFKEQLNINYVIALLVMILGTIFIILDIFKEKEKK